MKRTPSICVAGTPHIGIYSGGACALDRHGERGKSTLHVPPARAALAGQPQEGDKPGAWGRAVTSMVHSMVLPSRSHTAATTTAPGCPRPNPRNNLPPWRRATEGWSSAQDRCCAGTLCTWVLPTGAVEPGWP